MAKATDCVIDIDLAIKIRENHVALGVPLGTNGTLGFRCAECGNPVKPFAGPGVPHFEHIDWNPRCSRSD
jgi:hypothetical protein